MISHRSTANFPKICVIYSWDCTIRSGSSTYRDTFARQFKETIMTYKEAEALIPLGVASLATEGTLPGNTDMLGIGMAISLSDDD